MKIGTYYYPEQWPRAQWARDFDRIVSMGLSIVHMGEFAWFDMEPSPGDIRLDWLSECVELAAARKLDVILCTPTAAPPVWLTDQYPEVLGRNEHGSPLTRHGGRRHYIPTSLRMQEASLRIVTALAERFGDHPSVVGWQIDNELGLAFDQSEPTHHAFRLWLQKKYSTIDALNRACGNQFWNQYYQSFEQILMPPKRDPGYANPHHCLDASRFWSRAWADFTKLQADVLKPKIGARWISTNFMPFHADTDPGDFDESLSLWSWDSYPINGFGSNHTNENFRIGDPTGVELLHDQMHSYNGRWALMEVQPGQVNWSGYPCLPYPGAIRLHLWTAIAHGCEFITVYRLRQPTFGIEMWHDGLLQHDGVSLSPGGAQFKQVAQEISQLPGLDANVTQQEPTAGLVIDFDHIWWTQALPQSKRWNQAEVWCQYHQALSRMGFRVRSLHPGRAWDTKDLKIIVAPSLQMIDQSLIEKYQSYVDAGGHLVLSARSALQDRNGQFFEQDRAHAIASLIGGEVEAYDALPEETYGKIDIDGATHRWSIWADLLYAGEGTKVWARYQDQFYAGAAAITHRRHVRGTVTYNGVYGDRALAESVIEKLCRTVGIDVTALPDRVRVVRRGEYAIALNFNDTSVKTPAPSGVKFAVGGPVLPAAGVAVWRIDGR